MGKEDLTAVTAQCAECGWIDYIKNLKFVEGSGDEEHAICKRCGKIGYFIIAKGVALIE